MPAQQQSDREMDRAARSLKCLFGLKCRRGLDCHCGHTDVEKGLFADRRAYREKEWMAPCGFCAVGQCRYGAECQRNIRSRLSNEAYRAQRPATADSESDYASAESGSDSGDDSAGEAEMAGSAGCGSEGAVLGGALVPFLPEDFTDVINGWRPKVPSVVVKGEYRGFGEPPIFWMLDVLPPGSDRRDGGDQCGGDQCEVDAMDFVFRPSEGAVMSQKTQRRIAKQRKVGVVWAGPAVVREQRVVSRVPIGHRGARMRKVLFDEGDVGSSDGSSDGSHGSKGTDEVSVSDNTDEVSVSDKAEAGRKAGRKAEAARLAAIAKLYCKRYPDKGRGWLALQICHSICEDMRRLCKMKDYVHRWTAQLRAGIRAAKSELISGGGTAEESVKCRRFVRGFARFRDPGEWCKRAFTREMFERFQHIGLVPVADVPVTECGAVVQSAASVLRAVMLFKGLETFVQLSVLRAMGRAVDGFFGRWQAHQSRRFRREELMEDFVIQLYCGIERMAFKCMVERMVAWWARSLMLIKVVGKLERVAVGLTIRGATRQWVFNLWCTVCSAKIAAVAKAASDAAKTVAADVAKTAADAAKTAACAAMVEAVAKATAVTRADRAMQMQWSSMAGELEEIQQYY